MWKIALALIGLVSSAPLDNVDYSPMNSFALQLLEKTYIFQEDYGIKNIVISPISIWNIFSLLTEGASENTYSELLKVLNLPNNLEEIQALHATTNDVLKYNSTDITLVGKSVLFSDCSIDIESKFCDAANSYSTEIYSVDSKNTTKLAEDINYFISQATRGKISHAVKPENLDEIKMVLIDALYFKADWTNSFDPTETREQKFYNPKGDAIGSVNMMYHKAPHNLVDISDIGAQVLELTYGKSKDYSMLILLPFENLTTKALLNNLSIKSSTWMKSVLKAEDTEDVECYIPRFKLAYQLDMIPPLMNLGMHEIFTNASSLPGVSNSSLLVSSTVQNIDLEVTEGGTEAAVATITGFQLRLFNLFQKEINVNKEFVFLIVDRRSDLILFAGAYGDPSIV